MNEPTWSTWAFAVIGVLTVAALVIGFTAVLAYRLVHDWRSAEWVFDRPGLDPIHGNVEIEVRIPAPVPWRIAKWWAPRLYRRRCLEALCYPIEDARANRKATK